MKTRRANAPDVAFSRPSGQVVGLRVERMDYDEAVEAIVEAAHEPRALRVAAANVHVVMEARADRQLSELLSRFDLVLPDGQPLRWMLNALAEEPIRLAERVYGPELMLRVCDRAAREGLGVFLYGAHDATLAALEAELSRRFPELLVAGRLAPGFGEALWQGAAHDVERIRASGARIVLVGLGCPRQERWIGLHAEQLGMPCLGVGAAFDLFGGNKAMAPRWMQGRGLEWLYRLATEPRRTWRRYLLHNPRFVALAAAQLWRSRR